MTKNLEFTDRCLMESPLVSQQISQRYYDLGLIPVAVLSKL